MNITEEANEYIKQQHIEGFTNKQIIYSMYDGEYLSQIDMSQELSEEVLFILQTPHDSLNLNNKQQE